MRLRSNNVSDGDGMRPKLRTGTETGCEGDWGWSQSLAGTMIVRVLLTLLQFTPGGKYLKITKIVTNSHQEGVKKT